MPIILNPVTPWIIAIAVLLAGVVVWRLARRRGTAGRWLLRVPAVVLMLAGTALVAGHVVSLSKQATARRDHPMPGKLVDVGGYRLHVLCEGPKTSRTVVWLAGSYSQGLWVYPAHRDLARTDRSCVVDRGGLGWSDTGPFPRTVDTVLAETRKALIGAGETTPFVLVGHSFGGLYAANYAQRFPKDVAGLVLLDPTAPGWLGLFGASGCGGADGSPLTMLGTLFGLAYVDALNPLRGPGNAELKQRLGPEKWEALVAWELRPEARWSARSAMDEVCRDFYSVVRTPGALGAVPMLLIPQTPDLAEQTKYMPPNLTPAEQANYRAFNRFVSTEMAAMSSRSRVVYAPAGATHMFLDTQPAFALGEIRGFLASLDAPATPPLR